MIVRKLRLQRGWSQEYLAQASGLSVRTIQRIERGQKAGLESLNALAAVFDVELSQLHEDTEMNEENMTWEEQKALEYVRDLKGFYSHLISYIVVVGFLFIVNYLTSPGYIWAWWTLIGWGLGVLSHGLSVFETFNLFGSNWEKKQIEKRLGRKL